MAAGLIYDRYEVVGSNLTDVAKDIFDLANGKGTPNQGKTKRFAGHTELLFEHRFDWEYSKQTKTVNAQLNALRWTTTVRLPNWRRAQLNAAPVKHRTEWRRFLSALHIHELGHVFLSDFGMRRVMASMVGRPDGKFSLAVGAEPELNPDGSPRTPAAKQVTDQIDATGRQLIEKHAEFVAMNAKLDVYDAAPATPAAGAPAQIDVFSITDAADQPISTRHGETQGAVLDTNPP